MRVKGRGDRGAVSCNRHGGWVGGVSLGGELSGAVVDIVDGGTVGL